MVCNATSIKMTNNTMANIKIWPLKPNTYRIFHQCFNMYAYNPLPSCMRLLKSCWKYTLLCHGVSENSSQNLSRQQNSFKSINGFSPVILVPGNAGLVCGSLRREKARDVATCSALQIFTRENIIWCCLCEWVYMWQGFAVTDWIILEWDPV